MMFPPQNGIKSRSSFSAGYIVQWLARPNAVRLSKPLLPARCVGAFEKPPSFVQANAYGFTRKHSFRLSVGATSNSLLELLLRKKRRMGESGAQCSFSEKPIIITKGIRFFFLQQMGGERVSIARFDAGSKPHMRCTDGAVPYWV